MTTSVRERARAAQAEHISDSQKGSKALELAEGLYDQIDALDGPQRALLVTESAGLAKHALERILTSNNQEEAWAMVLVAVGLLGVTCYSNESNREDAGQTSMSDLAVDGVLDTVQSMTQHQTNQLLSPEQRDLAEEIQNAIDARVKRGEDHRAATNAELEAHKTQIAAVLGASKQTPAKEDKPSRYNDTGMYL